MFPGSHIRYGNAIKSKSASSPCTNVPVLCKEGSCAERHTQFWMYNVAAHYKSAHSGLRVTATIVRAMAANDPGAMKEIGDEISDEHAPARGMIHKIAAEFASVVSSTKKQSEKAAAQVAEQQAKRARLATTAEPQYGAIRTETAMIAAQYLLRQPAAAAAASAGATTDETKHSEGEQEGEPEGAEPAPDHQSEPIDAHEPDPEPDPDTDRPEPEPEPRPSRRRAHPTTTTGTRIGVGRASKRRRRLGEETSDEDEGE